MPNTTYGTPYAQSSDLVSNWPGVSSNVADRIDDVSFKGNGLNNQTGTSYTLVLTDAGKTVTLNNASAVTVTIPTDASVSYETGTVIQFTNKGAGVVTISPAGGVTLNNSVTLAQNASASIQKLDTNNWVMIGAQAPGLTLITSSTFSAVASLSINNCFTSTYDNYRIVIEMVAAVGVPNAISFRLRVGGSDDTGANYAYQYLYGQGASASAARATTQTGAWFYTAATAYRAIGSYDICGPAIARQTSMTGIQVYAANTLEVLTWANNHNQSTAYDGITIYPASSTITGTVRVYGYRNS